MQHEDCGMGSVEWSDFFYLNCTCIQCNTTLEETIHGQAQRGLNSGVVLSRGSIVFYGHDTVLPLTPHCCWDSFFCIVLPLPTVGNCFSL